MGEIRREGERKRTLAVGADEPEQHRASRPPLLPSDLCKVRTVGRSGLNISYSHLFSKTILTTDPPRHGGWSDVPYPSLDARAHLSPSRSV